MFTSDAPRPVRFSVETVNRRQPLRSDAEIQVNMCACSSRALGRVDALMDRLEFVLDKANRARLFTDASEGVRDGSPVRNTDPVKVRNVLLEADAYADTDYLTRGCENILDTEELTSSPKKNGLHGFRKREKKCKKHSRKSRSCSSEFSSSDSNSKCSNHSTDRGARKKSHRHKKKKKEKRKAKKRSRDSKDDSEERDRRGAKREKHKKKRDSSSRKSRRDLPKNSKKSVQRSKLSFSPYAEEEEECIRDRQIERMPGEQLCLKLPTKKLNGPCWVIKSSDERSSSSRDSPPPNGRERTSNSTSSKGQTAQPLSNGLRDTSSKHSNFELRSPRGDSVKGRAEGSTRRRNWNSEVSSLSVAAEDTPLQRKGSTKRRNWNSEVSSLSVAAEDTPLQRKSSSSPDCAKIRKLLANKKSPPEESATSGNGQTSSTANGSQSRQTESIAKSSLPRDEPSKWQNAEALPVAYRSRSASRSGSGSRSSSRSMSRRSRSTSRRSDSRRSDSRRRSSSRSTYTSRSRSKSFSSRSSRSRSYSRSHSRHQSLSIPRRSGSPSFLDKRRITRAPDGPSWRRRRMSRSRSSSRWWHSTSRSRSSSRSGRDRRSRSSRQWSTSSSDD